MPRINKAEIRAKLQADGIDFKVDFHALPSDKICKLVDAARACGYRRPRFANGLPARYFFYFLRS